MQKMHEKFLPLIQKLSRIFSIPVQQYDLYTLGFTHDVLITRRWLSVPAPAELTEQD